jgi:lipopolysaccharide export system permease protein
MPLRLLRYLTVQMLRTFVVVLLAIVGIYLVIDFADRARHYSGEGVALKVATLYGCKALVITYQLTPAALLLAAGACLSGLRRRNEITAISALTVSPVNIYAGVGLASFVVIAATIAIDPLVGWAGRRADEIAAVDFHQWGDYSTFYAHRRWFRSGDRIYFLRSTDGSNGFHDVSIFTVSPEFRLASRVDADEMMAQPDGSWLLRDGAERTFPAEGESHLEPFLERTFHFPEGPDSFRISIGRPEEIPAWELWNQVKLRRRLGLNYLSYLLALHNKVAYPLIGLPAALLAAVLALRRGRQGHLTTALMEGVAVVGLLWSANVIFRASVNSGRLSPAVAAWAPVVLLSLVVAVALYVID